MTILPWAFFFAFDRSSYKSLNLFLQVLLLRVDLGHVEFLVKGPQLVIPDCCDSPECLFHVLLHLLLLQKLLRSDGVSNVGFIGPSLEREYLGISLAGGLYHDFGLLLFLIGIHRLNILNWGSIQDVSPFALQILESLQWVLHACAHNWHKKQSRLQEKLLENTLGWRFLDPT